MTIESIIDLIMNNGIALGCVCYIILVQNNTMNKVVETLQTINTRLTIIEENLKRGEKYEK